MKTIYMLTNLINQKKYIGQTVNLKKRLQTHKSRIKDKDFIKFDLYKDIRDHGLDNFKVDILEESVSLKEANKKETYYIGKYNSYENGYNMTLGGNGNFLTVEMKKQISDTLKESWKKGVFDERKTNMKKAFEIAHKNCSNRAKAMWKNEEIRERIRQKISERHSRSIVAYRDNFEIKFNSYNEAIEFLKKEGWNNASKSAFSQSKKNNVKRYGYYWKS